MGDGYTWGKYGVPTGETSVGSDVSNTCDTFSYIVYEPLPLLSLRSSSLAGSKCVEFHNMTTSVCAYDVHMKVETMVQLPKNSRTAAG